MDGRNALSARCAPRAPSEPDQTTTRARECAARPKVPNANAHHLTNASSERKTIRSSQPTNQPRSDLPPTGQTGRALRLPPFVRNRSPIPNHPTTAPLPNESTSSEYWSRLPWMVDYRPPLVCWLWLQPGSGGAAPHPRGERSGCGSWMRSSRTNERGAAPRPLGPMRCQPSRDVDVSASPSD